MDQHERLRRSHIPVRSLTISALPGLASERSMVNASGEPVYVKFHWRSHQTPKQFNMAEATEMCGVDPDYAKRQLYELIEEGKDVRWTMALQVRLPSLTLSPTRLNEHRS